MTRAPRACEGWARPGRPRLTSEHPLELLEFRMKRNLAPRPWSPHTLPFSRCSQVTIASGMATNCTIARFGAPASTILRQPAFSMLRAFLDLSSGHWDARFRARMLCYVHRSGVWHYGQPGGTRSRKAKLNTNRMCACAFSRKPWAIDDRQTGSEQNQGTLTCPEHSLFLIIKCQKTLTCP